MPPENEKPINSRSPSYLFGQIQTSVGNIEKTQTSQSQIISKIFDKINNLPCGIHGERLDNLEEKQTAHSEFKRAMQITVIAACVAGLVSFVFTLF